MSNRSAVASGLAEEIGTPTDPQVEAKVEALARMPIVELRQHYKALFRKEPPKAFGPDLLRRSISWRLQEKAYGGLPAATRRLLRAAMKAMAAKPDARIDLPHRPGPGAVLERAWNGRRYRVMVLAEGYAFEGKTFTSLSEIASQITGTRWNGPRFFGLRQKSIPEDGTSSQGAASVASPASETSGSQNEGAQRGKSRRKPIRQRRSDHSDKPVEIDAASGGAADSSHRSESSAHKRRAPARVG
jgi:hypothetical protein